MDAMDDNTDRPTLVLGATGKTGSRVTAKLTQQGRAVRTASRHGSDIAFDWDDTTTFAPALADVGAVYLVAPVMRMDYAGIVSGFLDQAEQAGVDHVTYLSAYAMELAPADLPVRAVELDLLSRSALTTSIIRPAWFMQNFSESFLIPVDDTIAVPNGQGTEAYVHTDDIASVAAATLSTPSAHAGAAYAPTGPEALTVSQAAQHISAATGRAITYHPIDQDSWIDAMIAAGVPRDYTTMLRRLTSAIADGNGSRPNDDVVTVTGRPPINFAEFATEAAQSWKQSTLTTQSRSAR